MSPLAGRLADRWLRLPRRTIRLRLTAIYGALFLAAGGALLTTTYFLARHQYTRAFFIARAQGSVVTRRIVITKTGPAVKLLAGLPVPGVPVIGVVPIGVGTSPTPKQVVAAEAQSRATLDQLLVDLAIGLGISAVISIWLGWVVAGRALRPLRAIAGATRDISASSLHRRLALEGPEDEVKQLGDTIDDLLARLEGSFEAQRRFVANASHELRTPLTLERALIEVALADPDATVESLRETCAKVLAAGEQQERLIGALLTLSRGQRGLDRHEPVDLASLAAEAVESVDGNGLVFETALEPARTMGDPRLVERLVSNLVTNATLHNVAGGRVEVSTATRADRAVLTVANTGRTVPAGEVERLFEPFQRLDGDRTGETGGLGLGLSIVRAIAVAHHAPVTARSRPGGGLFVEVSFASTPLRA